MNEGPTVNIQPRSGEPSCDAAPKLPRAWIPGLRLLFRRVEAPPNYAANMRALHARGQVVVIARAQHWGPLFLHLLCQDLALPTPVCVHGPNPLTWMLPKHLFGNIAQLARRLWQKLLRRPHPALAPKTLPEAWHDRMQLEEDGHGPTTAQNIPVSQQHLAAAILDGRPSLLAIHPSIHSKDHHPPDCFALKALLATCGLTQKPLILIPHALIDPSQGGIPKIPWLMRLRGHTPPGSSNRLLGLYHLILGNRCLLRVGTPIEIDALPKTDDRLAPATLAKYLSEQILAEERVIAGPELPPNRATQAQLIQAEPIQEIIRQTVKTPAKLPSAVQKDIARGATATQALNRYAARVLNKIAARYRVNCIRFLGGLLHIAFNRIYDGLIIDYAGLDRAVEASRKGPLVFCPSHRSHVDYLVLSYVMWAYGITPPHIAAGANLAFFPIGALFRGCGAFFMRRSFRDDPIYAAVFKHYVFSLVAQGTSIEFFPEGTRSRTGKLLGPKLGLLSMIVDAWKNGAQEDVLFVPISVDYERIIEAGSYQKEQSGAPKKVEGIGGLLASTRILASRYGRLRVQFSEPISLKEFMAKERPRAKESEPRNQIKQLGYRIMIGISEVCALTPLALTATALLGHHPRGLRQSELLARVEILVSLLISQPGRLAPSLLQPTLRKDAILAAAGQLAKQGQLLVEEGSTSEAILWVPENQRVHLAFLRNAVMNSFAQPAMACLAFQACAKDGVATPEDIRAQCAFLSQLFKLEFIYGPGSSFDENYDYTLKNLIQQGVVDPNDTDHKIQTQNPQVAATLASLLDGFLQSYWVVAQALRDLRAFPLWQREVEKRALEQGWQAYREGQITHPEALGKMQIHTALQWMLHEDWVRESRGQGKRPSLYLPEDQSPDSLEALIQNIEAIWAASSSSKSALPPSS